MPINQSNASGSEASAWGWLRPLLPVWALALGLSAAVVAAGVRWPQPLTPDGGTVWALVLGLPLLMGLALVASGWFGAPAGDRDRGESGD
jgi:hypothetical protein